MSRKILNGLDLVSQRIQNLADGSAPTDAVTKQQLDAGIRGLDWKDNVRAATTTAITLSGLQTLDGVSLSAGDPVLVKNQATASANGIYLASAGAWTRRQDADENAEVTSGLTVTVTEGTTKGTGSSTSAPLAWTLTTADPVAVGTTALAFAAAGGGGTAYTAGNGLNLTGSAFSVKAGAGIAVDGSGVKVDGSVPRKYAIDVPAGSTSATITHGLGTLDVAVSIYEKTGGAVVETDVVVATVNTCTLTFGVAPSAGQYRVVVVG